MRKPFFSIIVPTYNRSKELKFAIDSVINQTFKNWELILVDNNSKDGTKKLIDNYNNSKIKLFTINNHGNIAKSRNLGIKKSSGKYLAFLDSDDEWLPEKLQLSYKILKKKISLIYHDMYIKKKVDQKFFKKTGYCRKLTNSPYEDLIFNGPAFPTSSVIIKKSIFKKINFFDENKNLITWEDFDAWIRIAKITNKFYKLKKILGYVWIGKENNLKPKNQIKNIYFFKKKYLNRNINDLPQWCNLSLMRSFLKTKRFDQSLKFIKKIKIEKLDLIKKLKILFFYLIIKLKISF